MLDLLRGTATINPADIRTDGGTQARLRIDQATVGEYAEAMAGGSMFPPVIVYYDGETHWLADGFHRLAAHKRARPDSAIPVEIRQGTRRDAVLCAVGSNASHGLRRTNDDKRNAVMTLLRDDEWGKWSSREIGRVAQVSHNFVNELRRSLSSDDSERTYMTRHGTTAIMQTENIGNGKTARQFRCSRCGRELTDPDAIAAGIGPCCARKPVGGMDGDGRASSPAWDGMLLRNAALAAHGTLGNADCLKAMYSNPGAPPSVREAYDRALNALTDLDTAIRLSARF